MKNPLKPVLTGIKPLPSFEIDPKTLDFVKKMFVCDKADSEMALADFNDDSTVIDSISRRLGISENTAGVAVRELIHLGLLKEQSGVLSKTNKKARWASGKSTPEIRNFHHQMMLKAQEELAKKTSEEDFAKRLITGITLTASPQKISTAKKKLSDALHEIANDLINDGGAEVYHLSAQPFPLTKN